MQVPSLAAFSFKGYDNNGNLTGGGVNTFGYDAENRLVSWSTASRSASYAYDPVGRRKAKTVDGTTTSYLSDGDREIAEYDNSGLLLRRFVYGVGLDEPLLHHADGGGHRSRKPGQARR